MNRTVYFIGGLVIIAALAVGGFFYVRPMIAQNYADKAISIFLDEEAEQYGEALEYLASAERWGRKTTNLGILKGQLLAALGRVDEAREQYELVRQSDPSAVAAIEDLLQSLQ